MYLYHFSRKKSRTTKRESPPVAENENHDGGGANQNDNIEPALKSREIEHSRTSPWIGAHSSTQGNIDAAIDRALEIGAECVQIFGSSPQKWARKTHSQQSIDDFRRKAKECNLKESFIHGCYLTNLAAQDPKHLESSISSLKEDMKLADALGITGVVFHPGSHRGSGFDAVVQQVVKSLKNVLEGSKCILCMETSAGGGDSIGRSFKELGILLDAVQDDRLYICIDTAHIHGAGYDITTELGRNNMLNEVNTYCHGRVRVIHANDSMVPRASCKDRHENIGKGHIGQEPFMHMMRMFSNISFILEVPGYDHHGPDVQNVELMKQLRSDAIKN